MNRKIATRRISDVKAPIYQIWLAHPTYGWLPVDVSTQLDGVLRSRLNYWLSYAHDCDLQMLEVRGPGDLRLLGERRRGEPPDEVLRVFERPRED